MLITDFVLSFSSTLDIKTETLCIADENKELEQF
jgi:hypothetical protein